MTNPSVRAKPQTRAGPDLGPVLEYATDTRQRSVPFLDMLRERGNISREHNTRVAANGLDLASALVRDGPKSARAVNHGLIRIVPRANVTIGAATRPFVVLEPRAGHGPGSVGMKHGGEIGVALAARHPRHFVGLLRNPMPGRTAVPPAAPGRGPCGSHRPLSSATGCTPEDGRAGKDPSRRQRTGASAEEGRYRIAGAEAIFAARDKVPSKRELTDA